MSPLAQVAEEAWSKFMARGSASTPDRGLWEEVAAAVCAELGASVAPELTAAADEGAAWEDRNLPFEEKIIRQRDREIALLRAALAATQKRLADLLETPR